jgi:hypothetical protein
VARRRRAVSPARAPPVGRAGGGPRHRGRGRRGAPRGDRHPGVARAGPPGRLLPPHPLPEADVALGPGRLARHRPRRPLRDRGGGDRLLRGQQRHPLGTGRSGAPQPPAPRRPRGRDRSQRRLPRALPGHAPGGPRAAPPHPRRHRLPDGADRGPLHGRHLPRLARGPGGGGGARLPLQPRLGRERGHPPRGAHRPGDPSLQDRLVGRARAGLVRPGAPPRARAALRAPDLAPRGQRAGGGDGGQPLRGGGDPEQARLRPVPRGARALQPRRPGRHRRLPPRDPPPDHPAAGAAPRGAGAVGAEVGLRLRGRRDPGRGLHSRGRVAPGPGSGDPHALGRAALLPGRAPRGRHAPQHRGLSHRRGHRGVLHPPGLGTDQLQRPDGADIHRRGEGAAERGRPARAGRPPPGSRKVRGPAGGAPGARSWACEAGARR